ncbi:fibronectin type III domain-containing protein [Chryseobacterium sp. G0240]|uniref:fibronectin type III domain-containing protein n=1 Tax=Chryseobacterium sp. G0240 TaxID=2487066 RepID=UPI000F456946|nr:fibronectin type III domain-containing protein [Chryseobacterium sp. G0240]ROI05456.1 fibronectin type III domain-containing protein [Chryseobacterium sp. G0240]
MALNWIITVAAPILTQGMSFQVKYRKLPSTNWLPYLPNPTSNTFTIPNLDESAEYEAEIRTVCVNGEVSQPIYHTNALTPPTLVLRWTDNQGTEDRMCTQNVCTANIEINKQDPNNIITKIDILKSIDNGVTWTNFIMDISTPTFADNLSSVGSNKYKAVATYLSGNIVESNILSYKGESMVKIDHMPDVFITIYKADAGSHYVGQVKFYGLTASTVDGSNITKVEIFCRFRAIGENIWWSTTETHIIQNPSQSVSINRQFPYGFKDSSKYVGTRDWNGADNILAEIKVYTSSGEVKIFNPTNISMPWYPDFPSSIT